MPPSLTRSTAQVRAAVLRQQGRHECTCNQKNAVPPALYSSGLTATGLCCRDAVGRTGASFGAVHSTVPPPAKRVPARQRHLLPLLSRLIGEGAGQGAGGLNHQTCGAVQRTTPKPNMHPHAVCPVRRCRPRIQVPIHHPTAAPLPAAASAAPGAAAAAARAAATA